MEDYENDYTYNKIKELLENINYKLLEHKPTKTSEESAIIRNTSLESGAKAMILKIDNGYCMIVISAALKFNNKSAKKLLSTRNLRFVNKEELQEISNDCLTGAIPPFGSIFKIITYVDESLIKQGDTISFNAGMRTRSIIMSTIDYINIEKPTVINLNN